MPSSDSSRAGRPWLAILVLIFLLFATIAYNTVLREVGRIDLATMEYEKVRCWEVFGRPVTRRVERRPTVVSMELADAGLTTGAKGAITWLQWRKPLVSILRHPTSGHSSTGRRVRNVAGSFEIAESISRRGDTTLDELTRIITEASDRNRYPKWTLSKAEERMRKTEREPPAGTRTPAN